jgi:hypothetical protein
MPQVYSDPARASDPHALPDVEVFYVEPGEWTHNGSPIESGWYFWPCFPGCLPDSDPIGPFGTEAEAIAAAQDSD